MNRPIPNEDYVKKEASRVTHDDLETTIQREKEILNKFNSLKKDKFTKFVNQGKLLLMLTKDYWNKKYKIIPWSSISVIIFSLLYFFSPIDFIPDFIPFFGFIDDIAVLAITFSFIQDDLKQYILWKGLKEEDYF